MALPGKPSTAHFYDKHGQCIYCHMYKATVEKLVHVCTKAREITVDGYWLDKKVGV
jgi:hypothetical protein